MVTRHFVQRIVAGSIRGGSVSKSQIKLAPGYAFESSRRNPKEPVHVIVGELECNHTNHVGYATIDDSSHAAFRHQISGKYYFQLSFEGPDS